MKSKISQFLSMALSADTADCIEWPFARQKRGYGIISTTRFKSGLAHRAVWELANGKDAPSGMCVCHSCDNPSCVNPKHLWLGTQRDNVRDMIDKGRANKASGDRNGSRLHPERLMRGENHFLRKHPEKTPRAFAECMARNPSLKRFGDENPARKYRDRISVGVRRARLLHPEKFVRGERVNTAVLTEDKVRAIRIEYAKTHRGRKRLAIKYGVSEFTIKDIVRRRSWKHLTP